MKPMLNRIIQADYLRASASHMLCLNHSIKHLFLDY